MKYKKRHLEKIFNFLEDFLYQFKNVTKILNFLNI